MTNLTWNWEVGVGDILTVVGFTFTIIGIVFAIVQLRQSTLVQRAQFLFDFTGRFFSDTEMRRFFYKVDYNRFVFDLDTFILSDDERLLDSLLYNFDIIGRMVRMNAITLEEVDVIAFEASRVLNNSEVRKYLHWLKGEYEQERRTTRPFDNAQYLAELLFSKQNTNR